jgi:hypothetical protein
MGLFHPFRMATTSPLILHITRLLVIVLNSQLSVVRLSYFTKITHKTVKLK